jgi:FtsZ-interacting cell division protein ZipA
VGVTNPFVLFNLLSPLFLVIIGISVICVFCIVFYTLKKRKSGIVHKKNVDTIKVNSKNSSSLVLDNTNNNGYLEPSLNVRENAFVSDAMENSTLVLSDSSHSMKNIHKVIDETMLKSGNKHETSYTKMKHKPRDEPELMQKFKDKYKIRFRLRK